MNNLQLACIYHSCSAKTKNGSCCKRNGAKEYNGKKYCWFHHRLVDVNYKKSCKTLLQIDSKNDDCSICYNLLNKPENICVTNCKHIFHLTCLNSWKQSQILQQMNSTCPICRKRLTIYRGGSKKLQVIMTNMDVTVKVSSV